eukprot:93896-Chlamydomonas_euryale.AAC.3
MRPPSLADGRRHAGCPPGRLSARRRRPQTAPTPAARPLESPPRRPPRWLLRPPRRAGRRGRAWRRAVVRGPAPDPEPGWPHHHPRRWPARERRQRRLPVRPPLRGTAETSDHGRNHNRQRQQQRRRGAAASGTAGSGVGRVTTAVLMYRPLRPLAVPFKLGGTERPSTPLTARPRPRRPSVPAHDAASRSPERSGLAARRAAAQSGQRDAAGGRRFDSKLLAGGTQRARPRLAVSPRRTHGDAAAEPASAAASRTRPVWVARKWGGAERVSALVVRSACVGWSEIRDICGGGDQLPMRLMKVRDSAATLGPSPRGVARCPEAAARWPALPPLRSSRSHQPPSFGTHGPRSNAAGGVATCDRGPLPPRCRCSSCTLCCTGARRCRPAADAAVQHNVQYRRAVLAYDLQKRKSGQTTSLAADHHVAAVPPA